MNIQTEIDKLLVKDFSKLSLEQLEYEYKILYLLRMCPAYWDKYEEGLDDKLSEVEYLINYSK